MRRESREGREGGEGLAGGVGFKAAALGAEGGEIVGDKTRRPHTTRHGHGQLFTRGGRMRGRGHRSGRGR